VILKKSTNINKTIISHLNALNIKKDVGNPGPGLGQAEICGWVKPVKGILPLDNWISSGNTYTMYKQKI